MEHLNPEDLHLIIDVFGAGMVAGLLEQAAELNADPSFRPWIGGVYEKMAPGPAVQTLARLARRPEVTRVEYRFGKKAGGTGELVSMNAQRAGR